MNGRDVASWPFATYCAAAQGWSLTEQSGHSHISFVAFRRQLYGYTA
jgi:hypothetical protein